MCWSPKPGREAFVAELSGRRAKALSARSPPTPTTPRSSTPAIARIERYVAEARQRGARVIEINPAGEPLPADERKLAPTLVIGPADDLAADAAKRFSGRCCR